jgi:hypothetical protein
MSLILSDKNTAPEGMESVPYQDMYVHYDPTEYTEDEVDDMIINAISGDDSELVGNSKKDTLAHNLTVAAMQ